MAYGPALKERVLKLYDLGEKTKVIAARLCVSPAYTRRVKQRRNEPARKITGRPPKLDGAARVKLAAWVDETPDATLEELRARCHTEMGVLISVGALWTTLRALKLTLKKSR